MVKCFFFSGLPFCKLLVFSTCRLRHILLPNNILRHPNRALGIFYGDIQISKQQPCCGLYVHYIEWSQEIIMQNYLLGGGIFVGGRMMSTALGLQVYYLAFNAAKTIRLSTVSISSINYKAKTCISWGGLKLDGILIGHQYIHI